ncbi:MAG TPA: L-seryl-tRNA(Sec) selenium transferase [Gemmatimonadales bacterium]|nr:L-seryl-tRNA(Sec) selenium transferase [Gemmatimonadales bacterium]
MNDRRRQLPSVDRLLHQPAVQELLQIASRGEVLAAVRESLDAARTRRAGPPEHWEADIRERLGRRTAAGLRPVLNATGVVLHTNLGRAPLPDPAIQAMTSVAGGYSNLELDLSSGTRGSRSDHCRALLQAATGAEDGLVVNNAAAALLLVLNAMAEGRDVLISRGELIEIGGSFRIPDILAKSGARLREVGTTNRTHLEDYRRGLDQNVAAVLSVHRSNFEQRGFVASAAPEALAALARDAGIPYLYDIGSGLIPDLSPWGLTGEPRVGDAVGAGADLVLFSGDKLLGGPQAGCVVGRREMIARCRQNPIARAVRADKLTLAALAATLTLYQDPAGTAVRSVPVLAMLTLSATELARRAERLAELCRPAVRAETVAGESAVGGGAFPGAVLPTTLVVIDAGELGPDGLALRLRVGDPAVVARVADGRVLLDPRTLPEETFHLVARAIEQALLS